MRGVVGANAAAHAYDLGWNVAVVIFVSTKIWCGEQNDEKNISMGRTITHGDDGDDDEAEHVEMFGKKFYDEEFVKVVDSVCNRIDVSTVRWTSD